MEPKFAKGLNEDSFVLIAKLLDKNPTTRLGSQPNDILNIQNSSFFQGVNWVKLRLKLIPLNLNFKINESRRDKSLSPHMFNDFSIDNAPKDSAFCHGIESDCSQTSLWVDNFTHYQLTSQTFIK